MMGYNFTEDCMVFMLIVQLNIISSTNFKLITDTTTTEIINIFLKIFENKKHILSNISINNVLSKCMYISKHALSGLHTLEKLHMLDKKKALKCAILHGNWEIVKEYMDNKIFLDERDIYLLLNFVDIEKYLPYLIINAITFDPKNLIPIFALARFGMNEYKKLSTYYNEYIEKYIPNDKRELLKKTNDTYVNNTFTVGKRVSNDYNISSTYLVFSQLYEKNRLNISVMSDDIMIILLNNKSIVNCFLFDMYGYKPSYSQIMLFTGNIMKQLTLTATFYPEQYQVFLNDFFKPDLVLTNGNTDNKTNNIENIKLTKSTKLSKSSESGELTEKPKKSSGKKQILKIKKNDQQKENLTELVDF